MEPKILRVLLVDNDLKLLASLSNILNHNGFEAISVDTGIAALAHTELQNFDVVLIELQLEDMSGLEVLHRIKAYSANSECILITDHPPQVSASEIINAGTYSYFQKPLDTDQLMLSIRRAGEKRMMQEVVQGIARENTERKQAEEALRQSEERFRSLYENAIVGMYRTAPDRHILMANSSLINMLGFESFETLAQHTLIELEDHEWDYSRSQFFDHMEKYGSMVRESFWRRRNGDKIFVLESVCAIRYPQGQIQYFDGVVEDITERKLAEEAIRRQLTELEVLYESGVTISGLLYPNEIAQKISELLKQKLDWHDTTIRLFDSKNESLESQAFNQSGLKSETKQHLANEHNPRSGLYVPMKLGEHVIGSISIESEQTNAFSESDERLLTTLANQVASALENARLIHETRQRIMELTALHRTGQKLLAVRPNPEEIYAVVHTTVAETMPCDTFVIVLDDEDHGEYRAVYFIDKGESFPEQRQPRGQGLSGRVITSGKTLLIGDTYEVNDLQVTLFGSMESTRSILAVPLHRGDVVIGMLSTQSYKPHVFGEPQRVMLETIAAQLSSALDNATLYQQTQARINELETLHTISTSLRTIQTIDKALSTLLDSALVTLETTAGSVLLYDPPSNELRDIVVRGWFTELAEVPIKAGEGVVGTVFATGELYSSFEFTRDALPHSSTRHLIPSGWGGVCLPIRASMDIIGVLFVSVKQPRYINSQQIRLLESLVDMAGSAVQRMRLHSETARRAEEFESLYDMSKTLSAEYDLNSLLGVIVNGIKVMMNASTSGMYLYHADSQELELTMDTEPSIPLGIRLQIGEGVAGKVAETRQPMRIDDYSTWEGRSEKFDNFPIRSVIEVPMLYAGELIGVLTADETGDSGRKFTDADERLLSLFASQAAGAINAARHREDTIRYAEGLEAGIVKLTEMDRKKNEFLSTVSHELRTPLTSIQSCIENLLSGMYGFLNEKQHSRLDIALAGAREESRLITNLLDLARIQEGKATLDLTLGDIRKIIHDIVGIFQYDAVGKNITILVELPPEKELEILVDAGKIKQVITNLLSNALKFTSEGGVITISLRSSAQQIEIRVKDTGIGIPEAEFQKIFDRFYQVDSSLTRKVGGTGIGLNIAKEYVEMHGGQIWLDSSIVGEGSTFMFILPIR